MEDEFESSARLLPAADEKPANSKTAAEIEPSEHREKKVSEMLLLTAGDEKQAESAPALESELMEGEEEGGIFQMQLLFPVEEKQVEGTLAAGSESSEHEENKVSEVLVLPAVEEKKAESKPLVESRPLVESKPAQSKVVEKKAFERPFRVKLRGSVLVLVRLPNKRSVRAAIHQLSTSGGVIHFEKPLDEKLEVELIFHLQKATIRSKAQMLFPMWATQGWMQPFRFVNLAESSRGVLDEKLKSFLGEAKGAAAGA